MKGIKRVDPKYKKGTGYQTEIALTYDFIVEQFGKPDPASADGKVNASWTLKTPAGYATIYDYKSDKAPELNETWHIGARTTEAAAKLVGAIAAARITPNEGGKRQRQQRFYEAYAEAREDALGYLDEIRHALNDRDNEVIDGKREVNWQLVTRTRMLAEALKNARKEIT